MSSGDVAPWLSQSRWPTVPIRYVAKLGTGHTPSRQRPDYWKNCTIPWMTLADVWQLRDGTRNTVAETKEKISQLGLVNSAAVLHPAGTVMLSRTASVGFSAIMGIDMATSQDFATWTCGPKLHSRFLLHALRAMAPDLRRVAAGSTHKTIYMPDIEQLRIPLPSVEEQRRIADFLDAETARLEKVVTIIRRQIELIDLREESLLHEFTDLVNVPSVQVKHVVAKLTSGPRGWGDLVADSGVPFLRITNVPRRGISLLLDDLLFVDAPPGPERERTRTRSGDVLISITADIGSVGVVEGEVVGGNVSQHIALLRPVQQICLSRWLAYTLRAPAANQALKTSSYGGTKIGLGLNEVAQVVIPLPDLSVQSRYVNMIDSALASAAACRTVLEKKLILLSERRQALITAVVTGRIDVTTARGIVG